MLPAHPPPTRILHRAGNFHDLLHLAQHPSVDAIEADIWVVRGHLVAHHERPIGPLLVHARGLAWRADRVPLEVILDAVKDHSHFIIDLRSWFWDPAPALARTLAANLEDFTHIHVTCEAWITADRLREWLPGLDVTYSIRSPKQLREFLEDVDAGKRKPTSVTVRESLLHTPDTVEEIRSRAGRVGAWTVDDTERALELKRWGIDQLVSNRLSVLNAI